MEKVTNRRTAARPAIGARTFGAGQRAPAQEEARSGQRPSPSARGGALSATSAPESPEEVRARLWALCGALPPEAYGPPWAALACELWESLASVLTEEAALSAVGNASRGAYPDCARALMRGAPAVGRLVSDVKGLARAAEPSDCGAGLPSVALGLAGPGLCPKSGPAPLPKKLEPEPSAPGAPLIYETLVY